MARIARIVVPGVPHHLTQRGNRRQTTFFQEEDYQVYLDLLESGCQKTNVEVWAYCLMPNHVHLVLVSESTDGLRATMGETHRRYTRHVNFREGWRGHLWQERFASFPMDDVHLLRAARYVELNPVRARLVKNPEDFPWSSARAHLYGEASSLVNTEALLTRVESWGDFLAEGLDDDHLEEMRLHERTGRPLGGGAFIDKIEKWTGRTLRLQRPGPKPKTSNN